MNKSILATIGLLSVFCQLVASIVLSVKVSPFFLIMTVPVLAYDIYRTIRELKA